MSLEIVRGGESGFTTLGIFLLSQFVRSLCCGRGGSRICVIAAAEVAFTFLLSTLFYDFYAHSEDKWLVLRPKPLRSTSIQEPAL